MTRFVCALATLLVLAGALPAQAAEAEHPPRQKWSFAGPFGKFDRGQLQRGLRVYREVCAACHGLSLVPFRTLSQKGGPEFTPGQIETLAAEYQVKDLNDSGESVDRPGRPSDRFPSPFPNEAAARTANGGAYPPDLSVMAKARTYERGLPVALLDILTQFQEQGPDYVTALFLGYGDPPEGKELPQGTYYNKYFPGNAIGMPQPLSEGQITYTDDAPQTVEQYAKDVTAFLMWAAEPHMEARKRLGLQVMIFLLIFATLLYFTKKKVWKQVELHPELQETRPAPEYRKP